MSKEFFIYLIKSGVILSLLYGFYFIFMRRETFYSLNRFLLLGILVISVMVPFISLPQQTAEFVNINQFRYMDDVSTAPTNEIANPVIQVIDEVVEFVWYQFLLYVYLLVVVLLSYRSIRDIIMVVRYFKIAEKEKSDNITIVYLTEINQTFSLLKYIFINPNLPANEQTRIINHEKSHIRNLHTIDLIIVEFFVLLQWFNPFIYLLRRSVKEVHEFQADEKAKGRGDEFIAYQHLLLNQVELNRTLSLTSSFNSITLKRFKMMTKTKSKKVRLISLTLLIPLIAALTLSFGDVTKIPFIDLPVSSNDSTNTAAWKTKYDHVPKNHEIGSIVNENELLLDTTDLRYDNSLFFTKGDTSITARPLSAGIQTVETMIGNLENGKLYLYAINGMLSINGEYYSAGLIKFKFSKPEIYELKGNVKKIDRSEYGFNQPSIFPVVKGEKVKVATGYGKRTHPIYKIEKMHNGVDITAPLGTDVLAAADGVIKKVDQSTTGYGHMIIIDHDILFSSMYAHLDTQFVKVGERVKCGEIIGQVGNTGMSTAPHLHYEIKKNGVHVDPAAYFE